MYTRGVPEPNNIINGCPKITFLASSIRKLRSGYRRVGPDNVLFGLKEFGSFRREHIVTKEAAGKLVANKLVGSSIFLETGFHLGHYTLYTFWS